MIRFSKDGERFRELDEERNFFLVEVEEILLNIRKRLTKEKRTVEPKSFECFIDGNPIIISHVDFEKDETLEKQLETTMMAFEGWEEEVRYLYINKLKDYAEEERQLLVNREFKAFVRRFDQVLGHPEMKPVPLLLGMHELKKLFDEVYATMSTGFYSELEEIMSAIQVAYRTIYEKMEKHEEEPIGEQINHWFQKEENSRNFINYVVATLQSVSKHRIPALVSRLKAYQIIENFLFEEFAENHGFLKAYDFHIEMMDLFNQKFDDILFSGFVLKTDDMLESLVLMPVIQKMQEKIQKVSKEVREDEEAEEEISVSEH